MLAESGDANDDADDVDAYFLGARSCLMRSKVLESKIHGLNAIQIDDGNNHYESTTTLITLTLTTTVRTSTTTTTFIDIITFCFSVKYFGSIALAVVKNPVQGCPMGRQDRL